MDADARSPCSAALPPAALPQIKNMKRIFSFFVCVCFHLILITESGRKNSFPFKFIQLRRRKKKLMILELIRSRIEVETMIDGLKKNV
jgi:hypothetical protein